MKQLKTLKDLIDANNRPDLSTEEWCKSKRTKQYFTQMLLVLDLQKEAKEWLKRLKEDHPLNEFKKREEYIQGQIDFIEVFFNLEEK